MKYLTTLFLLIFGFNVHAFGPYVAKIFEDNFSSDPSCFKDGKLNTEACSSHEVACKRNGFIRSMGVGLYSDKSQPHAIFKKIEKVLKVSAQGQQPLDVTSYFILTNGFPSIDKNKISSAASLFTDEVSVVFSGVCENAELKPQTKKFDVVSDPNSLQKIGTIEITKNGKDDYDKKFVSLANVKQDMSFKNYHSLCGYETSTPVGIFVPDAKNGYVNIQDGPWGKVGWIKSESHSISNSSLKFNFENLENADIVWDGTFYVLSGVNKKHPKYKDLEPGDPTGHLVETLKVKFAQLWDSDGTFLPQEYCIRD